jgi:hypothetical protein
VEPKASWTTSLHASGNPNAQYATSGPTLLYGINNPTNTGYNLKATPNGIYPNGGVGYFRYAQWQAIAEPWKSYRYMEVPFGGLYRDPSLTDRNVFDYFNKSLDGDNRRHWRNFDSFNASIDQTFFGTRMGFSLNYSSENYDDGSHSIFNDRTQTITVDVNATMPATNLANPNAGRAIMMGDGNYSTMHSEREEFPCIRICAVQGHRCIEGKLDYRYPGSSRVQRDVYEQHQRAS